MKKVVIGGIAAALAVATAVGVTVAVTADRAQEAQAPGASASPVPGADAAELARGFLDEWVDDGRVVRRDQGDDTVSEGQAYGLFAALLADDETAFDEIWSWTTDELQREDGLLAWQWADGAVVDEEPASDADLDAARALVVAADRFDRPDLRDDGIALATVILDELTVETDAGRILLPGLWAADAPHGYNPSYASPAAFSILSRATGDDRWEELARGSAEVTASMLDSVALPADWAQVHADGRIEMMPGALGNGDPVQYGFDAARLPLRYAESCSAGDGLLAARTYAAMGQQDDIVARLDLGGAPLTEDRTPLTYAARAAAAASDGDAQAGIADLQQAVALSGEVPTYYGTAWAMIGTAMLTSDVLGGCPALEGQSSSAGADLDAGGLQDPTGTVAAAGSGDATPVRVTIPKIGVDAGIQNLGLHDSGELAAPTTFEDVGWYADGVAPGDVGPAIIAGHVDGYAGPAVFIDLRTLVPGDEIVVTMSDGSDLTFDVTGSAQSQKSTFPTSDVYAGVPRPELRLITCAGTFDTATRDYSDNLIVYAALQA